MSGNSIPKAPLQLQAVVGGRNLKREREIITKVLSRNPDQSSASKRSHQEDGNINDPISDRYYSLTYTFMFPLLTLDESTLFYWTLSNTSHKKQKHSSAINEWASAIPINTKSALRAPKSTSSHTGSDIPSLSGNSRSSAPSVLTNNVKIISH